MKRGIHVVNGLLALALAGFSVGAWSRLPGADGSLWSWFGLPMIGVLTVGLLYFGAYAITRWPVTLNVPDKRRFLAMRPEQQAPVIAMSRRLLYFVATQMLLLFGIAQMGMWSAARGEPHEAYTVAVLLLAVAMGPLSLIVWMPRVQRAIREAEAT